MDKPLDVLSVAPEGQGCQKNSHNIHFRQSGGGTLVHPHLSKYHQHNNKAYITQKRTQGYIVGEEKNRKNTTAHTRNILQSKANKRPTEAAMPLPPLNFI